MNDLSLTNAAVARVPRATAEPVAKPAVKLVATPAAKPVGLEGTAQGTRETRVPSADCDGLWHGLCDGFKTSTWIVFFKTNTQIVFFK